MMRAAFIISLFTIVFSLMPEANAAWRGYAVVDLNIRAGPGTRYRVVDVIPAGARMRVERCRRSWCAVRFRGRSGWASRRYIRGAPRRAAPPIYIEPFYDEPFYDEPFYDEPFFDDPYGIGPGIYFGTRRYRRYGDLRPRVQQPGHIRRPHLREPVYQNRPRIFRPRILGVRPHRDVWTYGRGPRGQGGPHRRRIVGIPG